VLAHALETLPRGLSDTYVRILERIEHQPSYMRNLALNCLAWIIYAQRPLSIEELQEALAINSTCTSIHDLQPDSPQVILEACGNLLEEVNDAIRPIHYTVQEFLTTATGQELLPHAVRTQLLDSSSMHTRLSLACLAYIELASFAKPAQEGYKLHERLFYNVFAGYACQNFDYHISCCDKTPQNIMDELERLFNRDNTYLAAVLQIRILQGDYAYNSIIQQFNPVEFLVSASTIMYSTSLYNITAIRQRWVDQTTPKYALHLAASARLSSAINRLLKEGCDVNEKDGSGSTPLYYACLNNGPKIVQLLLNRRAYINVQGGYYGNALYAASARGHEQVVKILLDKGADINAQSGGDYSNALETASARGYKQIVKMLLEKGADANGQGGYYGNALQAASARGHEQIVKMLLKKGADANGQGGHYGNALQAASARGHKQILKILLDEGADIQVQGGYFGNALQAASVGGYEQVVKTLLDEGADANGQGGYYGNALQAASARGHEQIVKMLLDAGAKPLEENIVPEVR
jgi:ankyrin repeat protein